MASVTISNIESGMTVGTSFVVYGQFDTRVALTTTMSMVTCTIQIGASSFTASQSVFAPRKLPANRPTVLALLRPG